MKTNPSLFCPGNRPESRGATEVRESFRLRRQREGWTRMKGSFVCVCSCCGRMILSWLEKAASWGCFLVKDEEGMEIITARPPSLVCNQQFLWSTIWDEKKNTQLHKSNHSRVEKCLRCQGPRIMVYIPKCKCCCHKKKREQSDYSGWKQTDHTCGPTPSDRLRLHSSSAAEFPWALTLLEGENVPVVIIKVSHNHC